MSILQKKKNISNIKENITEDIKLGNIEDSKTMPKKPKKNISQKNINANVKDLDAIKQNKGNIRRSFSSHININNINLNNIEYNDNKQELKNGTNNIVNISNDKLSNINIDKLNHKNGNEINHDKNNSISLEKNPFCVNVNFTQNNQINTHHDGSNVLQNLLSPKKSKEEKISHLFNNNKNEENGNASQNNLENKNALDDFHINDNLIFSDNEGQNDTINININLNANNDNLKINQINLEKVENHNNSNESEQKEECPINNNITTKREEESKINTINENNNDETINNNENYIENDNIINKNIINIENNKNNEDFYYKTFQINRNKNNFFGISIDNKNFKEQDIKLNYLTEFYSTTPKESKRIIIDERKDETV